jgi:tetratricopeptide (TPR) repeat protein
MSSFLSSRSTAARWVFVCGLLVGLLLAPSLAAQAPDWGDSTAVAPLQARQLFVRGMTQSYLEDHEEAVSYFEKALELAPREPAILVALAEAEAARDNVTSALYYARQARDRAADQPYYYRTLAELLHRAGESQEAVATYQRLLATFPDENNARLALARLLTDLDQPQRALQTYETLIDSSDRSLSATVYAEMLPLYRQVGDTDGRERVLKVLVTNSQTPRPYREQLARLYVDQKRFEAAIPVFETLVRDTPNDPQLLSRLQMLYEETGQPEEAQALWDSFDTKNASPDQLVARARALYDDRREAKESLDPNAVTPAVQLLRRALADAPKHVPALDLLGRIHYQTGAYDDAATIFQRAIDANPRDPERWRYAARAHLAGGQPQQAVEVAEEGLLLFPGRADLLRPLAYGHLRQTEYDTALTRFEEALDKVESRSGPPHLRAALYAGRGRALDALGQTERATSDYEAALELDPAQPTALWHYARLLVQQKQNLSRARRLAQRAVEASPSTPEALNTLGWIYFKQGSLSEANDVLRKAVETGAASAAVYEHLGDVQRALGNDDRARQYWKKALDLDPERDAVQEKLESLRGSAPSSPPSGKT